MPVVTLLCGQFLYNNVKNSPELRLDVRRFVCCSHMSKELLLSYKMKPIFTGGRGAL